MSSTSGSDSEHPLASAECSDCDAISDSVDIRTYEVRRCDTLPNSMGGVELVVREHGKSWRTAQIHHFGDRESGVVSHRKLVLTVAHPQKDGPGFEFEPPAHRWTCEDGDFEALGRFLLGEVDGSFMVLPTGGIGPAARSKAIALVAKELLGHPGALETLFGGDHSELADALNSGIRVLELRKAVRELEVMLQRDERAESKYQDWCERHSWAFGNSYVMRDTVRNIGDGDSVDLLLQQAGQGYRDLIELKTPQPEVLNFDASHKSYYFTAEVSKVIGQCHRYLDNLHRKVGVVGLTDYPWLSIYHPRATIVIGRSDEWLQPKSAALHGLNSRLNGIRVMTFDHLLAQAKSTLSALGG